MYTILLLITVAGTIAPSDSLNYLSLFALVLLSRPIPAKLGTTVTAQSNAVIAMPLDQLIFINSSKLVLNLLRPIAAMISATTASPEHFGSHLCEIYAVEALVLAPPAPHSVEAKAND